MGAPHPSPTLALRDFAPDDECRLVELWNGAYAHYAGHVPRTVEYWRWCILERPGVGPGNVLIVTDESGPVGYGALGPNGRVLEMAVQAQLNERSREAAAMILIQALEDRSRTQGAHAISFVLPRSDDVVQRSLQRSGYRTEGVGSFTATITDISALFDAMLRKRQNQFPHNWSASFQFDVERGPDRVYPRQVVHVRIGPPLVVETELQSDGPVQAKDGVCTVSLPLSTLNRIVFRRETFDEAIKNGKLTVAPHACMGDVRTFMQLVTFAAPWYTPTSDAR